MSLAAHVRVHSRVVRWLVAIRTANLATTAALRYSAQREPP